MAFRLRALGKKRPSLRSPFTQGVLAMRPRPTRFAVRAVLAIVLSAGCSPSERLVLVNVKTSPEELGTSISSLNVKSVFENQTLVIKEFPVSLGIYVPRET